MRKEVYYYPTLFGEVAIATDENGITDVSLKDHFQIDGHIVQENEWMQAAIRQLTEYFLGKRKSFSLPLAPQGTEYQKKVWKILETIPYGEVMTYKQVAFAAGNEKGSRGVGQACSKNPIWIIVPCHRVIGSNGKLTGYAGGLTVKEQLLALEQKNK